MKRIRFDDILYEFEAGAFVHELKNRNRFVQDLPHWIEKNIHQAEADNQSYSSTPSCIKVSTGWRSARSFLCDDHVIFRLNVLMCGQPLRPFLFAATMLHICAKNHTAAANKVFRL
jgi:hypothetical protein